MVIEQITSPQVVKNWSYDEKVSWAEEYGQKLWEEHGDDDVVSEFTDEEAEKDRQKAWDVVYNENETEIISNLNIVDTSNRFDMLVTSVEEGFNQAYEEARKN